MAQLPQGLGLDLADPFPGDIKLLAHLFQGAGAAVLQAKAQAPALSLPGGEESSTLLRVSFSKVWEAASARGRRVVIGDKVPQMAVFFLADGGFQGTGS